MRFVVSDKISSSSSSFTFASSFLDTKIFPLFLPNDKDCFFDDDEKEEEEEIVGAPLTAFKAQRKRDVISSSLLYSRARNEGVPCA
jgi:hypothetical protein